MVKPRKKESFNLLHDVPMIHNTEELAQWLQPHYNLMELLRDVDTYHEHLTKFTNIIRGCFTIYECRTFPISFKFNSNERKYHKMELRLFYVNFILWRPFVEVAEFGALTPEHMVTDLHKVIPHINDFLNEHLIDVLREYQIESTTVNYDIAEVLHNLIQIDIDYGLILGLNFSIQTFTELYEKNPEIKEIMESKFPETMQPHEIEQKLDTLQAREIEIYESIPEHPIGVILRAGTGIKHKQLTEFTISEGLKPSMEGKTIPKPIENSTLVGGLDKPSSLFLDGTGARKSLVQNKKVINYLSQHAVMYVSNLFNCWEILLGHQYQRVII